MDQVAEFLRQLLQGELELASNRRDYTVGDALPATLAFQQTMAVILVSSPAMDVTFKVHFMTNHARRLVAAKWGISDLEVGDARAIDFMKELCNLLAGRLKHRLATSGIAAGHSLPFAIQGFNEIFFNNERADWLLRRAWTFDCPAGRLHASVVMAVFDPSLLPTLEGLRHESVEPTGAGEIEMF